MKLLLLALVAWTSLGFGASATFEPLNPVPQGVSITPSAVLPGGTATLSYSAALADSCAVTQSGCATAPTLPPAACTGAGPQQTCSSSVTVTIPTNAAPCVDALRVTCQPGSVVSSTSLTITAPPSDCSALIPLPTPTAGKNWKVVLQSRVLWGDGTTGPLVNARDYLVMWTYPGNTPSWPGNSGGTTRPTGASPYMYFSEKFTVPADYTMGQGPRWAWTGSGNNSNASITISPCSGDFGQLGSQIMPYCRVNQSQSGGGMRTYVNAAQQGTACTLAPGKSYYLNFLPEGNLPKNPYDLSVSSCGSSVCSPWFVIWN